MAANIRKPAAPPRPDDIADRERWEAITANSLATTQAAAEKWRTGLAAFATLVTGGLFLKGPEAANDIASSWRALLTAMAATGLLLAVIGLWLALRAAAGAPGEVSYKALVDEYGGVRQFEIAAARRSSKALRWAKIVVALSLLVLGATAFTWWWVPTQPASPLAYVQAETSTDIVCGTLISADGQTLRIKVDGASAPALVPFDDVGNLELAPECRD